MVDLTDPGFLIPSVIAVTALVVSVIEVRRGKQEREVSKAMLDIIKTMRKELKEVRQSPNVIYSDASSQAELRRREQMEWNKLKDVTKAVGWVWDRLAEEDS